MLKRFDTSLEDVEAGVGTTARNGRPPVLIVVHQWHSSPGHVGRWLRLNGFPLDIRRPRFGDPLPATLKDHSGAVIFGGPMSASDRGEFMRRETDWLDVPLKEDKPFLGICLGAQMLAAKLGGRVSFHPDGVAEIGYWPLHPTPEGEAQFAWPRRVYQWHREGFDLPSGATLLAQGETFPNQAFRAGANAYAIQFHPEISHALVNRWTTHAAHRLVLPGAAPRQAHMEGHLAHGAEQRQWLGAFLAKWTGLDRVAPGWR